MPRHIVEFTEYIAKAYMVRLVWVDDIIKLEAIDDGLTRVYLKDHCHRGPFIIAAHSMEELQSRIDANYTWDDWQTNPNSTFLRNGFDGKGR